MLLSLGSNLGDRATALREAVEAIGAVPGVRVCAVSSVYESEPWGVVEQPRFLNMAVEIETGLEPLELLNTVKAIEVRLGRVAGGVKWGPRLIDIDLILCGDLVVQGPELVLPHPEFRRRAFVLAPLAEIAGAAVDPVSGLTVAELALRPEVEGRAWKVEKL